MHQTVSRILITQPYQECHANGGNPGTDGLFHKRKGGPWEKAVLGSYLLRASVHCLQYRGRSVNPTHPLSEFWK